MIFVGIRLQEKLGEWFAVQSVPFYPEQGGDGGVGLNDHAVYAQGAIANRGEIVEVKITRPRSVQFCPRTTQLVILGFQFCLLLAEDPLRRILFRDIAEHQHCPDHGAAVVANRCAAVSDISLAAIARNQHRVVGQTLNRALRQCCRNRNHRGLPGFLVDDLKNVGDLTALGLCVGPTGQQFAGGVQQRHVRFGISGNDCVADGIERYRELGFADLQADVGLP